MQDYNYASLKQQIAPMMMMLGRNYGGLIVKIKTTSIESFLNDLKKQWNAYNPSGPLEYNFLDEAFQKNYQSEQTMFHTVSLFALTGIVISCLGLFGLAIYTMERRKREISIRKVLGANPGILIGLLSKDFLKLVMYSFIVACPVAWWLMHKWLAQYPYRVTISWQVFAFAGK